MVMPPSCAVSNAGGRLGEGPERSRRARSYSSIRPWPGSGASPRLGPRPSQSSAPASATCDRQLRQDVDALDIEADDTARSRIATSTGRPASTIVARSSSRSRPALRNSSGASRRRRAGQGPVRSGDAEIAARTAVRRAAEREAVGARCGPAGAGGQHDGMIEPGQDAEEQGGEQGDQREREGVATEREDPAHLVDTQEADDRADDDGAEDRLREVREEREQRERGDDHEAATRNETSGVRAPALSFAALWLAPPADDEPLEQPGQQVAPPFGDQLLVGSISSRCSSANRWATVRLSALPTIEMATAPGINARNSCPVDERERRDRQPALDHPDDLDALGGRRAARPQGCRR